MRHTYAFLTLLVAYPFTLADDLDVGADDVVIDYEEVFGTSNLPSPAPPEADEPEPPMSPSPKRGHDVLGGEQLLDGEASSDELGSSASFLPFYCGVSSDQRSCFQAQRSEYGSTTRPQQTPPASRVRPERALAPPALPIRARFSPLPPYPAPRYPHLLPSLLKQTRKTCLHFVHAPQNGARGRLVPHTAPRGHAFPSMPPFSR